MIKYKQGRINWYKKMYINGIMETELDSYVKNRE